MTEKQVAEKIIDLLEENKCKVFSATEICEMLEVPFRILTSKLHNLTKHNEIGVEKISFRVARKIYKDSNIKRGLTLYFLE